MDRFELLGGHGVGLQVRAAGGASRIFGLMTASFGLGQIVGPIFAGWVHDLTGTFLLPSVAAAASLLLAALLVWRFSAAALRFGRSRGDLAR